MEDPNQLDPIFQQIQEFLRLIQDKKTKPGEGKLDPDIDKQLFMLEEEFRLFREATDLALERSGMKKNKVEGLIKEPKDEFSSEAKRNLDHAKQMEKQVKALKDDVAKKNAFAKIQKTKSKTAGKKRKKKFKRLGGDGWMPL